MLVFLEGIPFFVDQIGWFPKVLPIHTIPWEMVYLDTYMKWLTFFNGKLVGKYTIYHTWMVWVMSYPIECIVSYQDQILVYITIKNHMSVIWS